MATGNRITNHRDVVYIGVPRIRHVFQLKGQDGYFTAYTRSRPVMAIFKETSVARPANSDGPRKIFSIVSGCIPSSRDQTVTHSAYVTSRFSTIVCSPTRRHYSFFLRLGAQWFSINGSLSTIRWRRFFLIAFDVSVSRLRCSAAVVLDLHGVYIFFDLRIIIGRKEKLVEEKFIFSVQLIGTYDLIG